jgi:hypothetical protein
MILLQLFAQLKRMADGDPEMLSSKLATFRYCKIAKKMSDFLVFILN